LRDGCAEVERILREDSAERVPRGAAEVLVPARPEALVRTRSASKPASRPCCEASFHKFVNLQTGAYSMTLNFTPTTP
jgi:hypothetical protein